MKTRQWIGLALSGVYLAFFAIAAFGSEPLGVLFIDGINTLIITLIEEISGSYSSDILPFPLNVILGTVEWYIIGAYFIPFMARLILRIAPRKTGPADSPHIR